MTWKTRTAFGLWTIALVVAASGLADGYALQITEHERTTGIRIHAQAGQWFAYAPNWSCDRDRGTGSYAVVTCDRSNSADAARTCTPLSVHVDAWGSGSARGTSTCVRSWAPDVSVSCETIAPGSCQESKSSSVSYNSVRCTLERYGGASASIVCTP